MNQNNRDERAIQLTNNGLYSAKKEKLYQISSLRSETFGGMDYSESMTNNPRIKKRKIRTKSSSI